MQAFSQLFFMCNYFCARESLFLGMEEAGNREV